MESAALQAGGLRLSLASAKGSVHALRRLFCVLALARVGRARSAFDSRDPTAILSVLNAMGSARSEDDGGALYRRQGRPAEVHRRFL